MIKKLGAILFALAAFTACASAQSVGKLEAFSVWGNSTNSENYAKSTPISTMIASVTGLGLASPTITGGVLAGTFSGTPTYSGVPIYSGLSSGTCTNGVGLDSGHNLITVACPGSASSIQDGVTTISSGTPGTLLYNNSGVLGNVPYVAPTAPVICDILTTTATTCHNGGSSANNGTYTPPAGALYLHIRSVGGGGGGGGSGTGGGAGGNTGGNTTFNTSLIAGGGNGGGSGSSVATGGLGGNASGCAINITGTTGGSTTGGTTAAGIGGAGGSSPFFGGGPASSAFGGGLSGAGNTGGGGSGGYISGGTFPGGAGGGGGAGCESWITSPSGTYPYAIGALGSGGAPGTSGNGGGDGARGHLIIEAYFN